MGWKEREGVVQTSASLQGTQGKEPDRKAPAETPVPVCPPSPRGSPRGGSGQARRLGFETLWALAAPAHLSQVSSSAPSLPSQDYKSSLADISSLLQLEPRNGPARRLQQEVKQSLN